MGWFARPRQQQRQEQVCVTGFLAEAPTGHRLSMCGGSPVGYGGIVLAEARIAQAGSMGPNVTSAGDLGISLEMFGRARIFCVAVAVSSR
ncbi:hypothetical protein IFM12275_15310 [Nocardia sputorum]|nr:hypothetical protein IFM12275_15310 [Nocardia sputorum]